MRAILINSEAETVTQVEHSGDYRDIYRLCGFDTFTTLDLGDGETLYIDDEGLLKNPEHFFALVGPDFRFDQLLAGNGLILATNDEGESVGSTLALDLVRQNVRFKRASVAGWTEPRSYDVPGGGFVIEGARPIFGEPIEKESSNAKQ